MEYVHPIRDKKKLRDMKTYLMGKSMRDYCMFTLGIHSGLRIGDILRLTIGDVLDKKGKPRDRIIIREQKTGKNKEFPLSGPAAKALLEYLENRENHLRGDPLFLSRKGKEALQRQQAYKIINEAARAVGISEKIGTHTMRKTFGYHAFRGGVSMTMLMKLFNHSAPSITARYLGITSDEMDEVYLNLDLYR